MRRSVRRNPGYPPLGTVAPPLVEEGCVGATGATGWVGPAAWVGVTGAVVGAVAGVSVVGLLVARVLVVGVPVGVVVP